MALFLIRRGSSTTIKWFQYKFFLYFGVVESRSRKPLASKGTHCPWSSTRRAFLLLIDLPLLPKSQFCWDDGQGGFVHGGRNQGGLQRLCERCRLPSLVEKMTTDNEWMKKGRRFTAKTNTELHVEVNPNHINGTSFLLWATSYLTTHEIPWLMTMCIHPTLEDVNLNFRLHESKCCQCTRCHQLWLSPCGESVSAVTSKCRNRGRDPFLFENWVRQHLGHLFRKRTVFFCQLLLLI